MEAKKRNAFTPNVQTAVISCFVVGAAFMLTYWRGKSSQKEEEETESSADFESESHDENEFIGAPAMELMEHPLPGVSVSGITMTLILFMCFNTNFQEHDIGDVFHQPHSLKPGSLHPFLEAPNWGHIDDEVIIVQPYHDKSTALDSFQGDAKQKNGKKERKKNAGKAAKEEMKRLEKESRNIRRWLTSFLALFVMYGMWNAEHDDFDSDKESEKRRYRQSKGNGKEIPKFKNKIHWDESESSIIESESKDESEKRESTERALAFAFTAGAMVAFKANLEESESFEGYSEFLEDSSSWNDNFYCKCGSPLRLLNVGNMWCSNKRKCLREISKTTTDSNLSLYECPKCETILCDMCASKQKEELYEAAMNWEDEQEREDVLDALDWIENVEESERCEYSPKIKRS